MALRCLSVPDEARQQGWTVISMKNDRKRIPPFEEK
jgi:hypothetical protein